MNNEIKIATTMEVVDRLLYSIENKKPFSTIRFGDGALKFIHSYMYNDEEQLKAISKKEGIPIIKIGETIDLWAASANICDFIDSPAVYSSSKFWKRIKKNKSISKETAQKIHEWQVLYELAGFKNTSYCNPEINFLMCLDTFGEKSLPDILYGKKICIITSRLDIKEALLEYEFDVITVAAQGNEHYINSFNDVLIKISNNARKYDLFLIAAGELGRIYTGLIKYNKGRALDIGSLIDFWCNGKVPDRLQKFMTNHPENRLKLTLTDIAKQYERYL